MGNEPGYAPFGSEEVEGWDYVRLSDVLSKLESGSRARGGSLGVNEGVPSIGGEHITRDGRLDFANIRYVPSEFFASMKRGKVKEGDVLLVKDGATTGKVTMVRDLPFQEIAVNEHVFILRGRENLDQTYLFYCIASSPAQRLIKSIQTGSAQPGINSKFSEYLVIPVPPLPEQERIAAILSTIDEAIQKTDEIIASTQQLKRGLVQRLLTEGIGHTKFKKTEIGEIPEDWDVLQLGQILDEPIKNGYSPVGPSQPTGKWVLTLSALSADGLRIECVKPAPIDDPDVDRSMLRPGDILISRSNTRELVGLAALYSGNPQDCSYPDLMMRIRAQERILDKYFLEEWLRHPKSRNYLRSRAAGTSGSMVKINRAVVAGLYIPIPPLSEQTNIVSRLSIVGKKLSLERQNRQRLTLLKSGLMQSLLTGKVRVKVN